MNTGIDALYTWLTRELANDYETVAAEADDICACCGRLSLAWVRTDVKVVGNSYGKDETHCVACHALYHPAFDQLGIESEKGSNRKGMKLGMLRGCGALVGPGFSVIYAPGKYFPKFKAAPAPLFKEIVSLGGPAVVRDVLARAPSPPFLFITDFGVKKADLVENLVVTVNAPGIIACSEGAHYELPAMYAELEQELGLLAAKDRKRWIELAKRSLSQYLPMADAGELAQITNSRDELKAAVRGLPADPHARRNIFNLLGG